MPVYCVTARHSPLPRKRLIIEAEGEDEAIELFLEENRDQAENRKKSGAKLVALVAQWESNDGHLTIDVEDAAPDAVVDLPRPDPVLEPKKAKVPPHIGRMGRRPSKPPEETETKQTRRRSKREADFEAQRDEQLLGRHREAVENERPLNTEPAFPLPGMEERMAERQPAEKKPRPARSRKKQSEGGPATGGVQVLGVTDDAPLPDGLDPIPDSE